MKKICHIGPGQDTCHIRIFHRFCWSQARAGYRVELIAHDDGETYDCAVHIHDLGALRPFSLRWNLWWRFARNVKAYLTAIRTHADLYFVYSPEFIPFALLLKWITGKPVVFDCMEDFIGYARQRAGIPNGLRDILAFIIRQVFRFAARHFDFITVADLGTENQFREYTSKVITIHNFPRLDLFPPLSPERPDNCDFDLVYHGTNHRYYLEILLDIDRQLQKLGKTVTWYLFGTFAELEWFRSELRRRDAESRFFIGGLVPHDRVFSEVQRARIGIIPLPALPKYLNNIPQKLFEYMALGLPVVLSDLPPSRPFVAGNDVGIMVDPNDHLAYAQAIINLLNDPGGCRGMGMRGRQLVEQKYNWEIESEKLMSLVKELTTPRPESVT